MGALLAQYHADATLIGFDFTVKGHETIRKHLEGYLERPSTLKLIAATESYSQTSTLLRLFPPARYTVHMSERRAKKDEPCRIP